VLGTGDTTYAYDADRNPTTITRPDGHSSVVTPTATIDYAYSTTTGNLSSASIVGGEGLSYGYNGPLPTSSTWTGTVAGSVSRAYNNNFWVTSHSIDGADTIASTYDNDGLVTKAGALALARNTTDGSITGTILGAATDVRTYNSFGELTGYTASYSGAPVHTVNFTRDTDGRVSGKTETIGGATNSFAYAYDAAGRLTGVARNGKSVSSYTYDSNSNRLKVTTPSGTVTATYDAQDRLLPYGSASFTYTANGELESQSTAGKTTNYSYDVLGDLTAATLPSGTKIAYIIDAENRRVGKEVNGVLEQGFLYDGERIIAQLNGSNAVVSQFIYATGSTAPDYMISGGVTYRILSDHLGSPRLVVNTSTGQIAEEIDYDEFGNVIRDTKPGFQPFGFAGGLYDQDTKLVRFGARDYHPSTGRWTAKDPILFNGGDTDLYGYVFNDPMDMVDPAGLDGQNCTAARSLKS
jgi:RHS repeat-associated protein